MMLAFGRPIVLTAGLGFSGNIRPIMQIKAIADTKEIRLSRLITSASWRLLSIVFNIKLEQRKLDMGEIDPTIHSPRTSPYVPPPVPVYERDFHSPPRVEVIEDFSRGWASGRSTPEVELLKVSEEEATDTAREEPAGPKLAIVRLKML